MRAPLPRRGTSVLLLTLAAVAAFLTPAAVAGPAYGGYLFFYFTGEDAATGEQVYLAAPGYSVIDSLPASPRHGTVLPVTSAELARVRAAFR